MLASDFVLGIGNRWANRHTGGLDIYRAGRTFVHVDIEPTQIGRVFAPDYGIVSDARAALRAVRRGGPRAPGGGRLPDRARVGRGVPRSASATHAAAHPLRQRADQAAAGVRGDEPGVRPGHPLRQHDRPVADRRRRSSCTSTGRGTGSTPARPARWAGRMPAALGVCVADPDATVVALSGDYDFQFMIEELAVGAQFNLPYIHVLVNNAYLGPDPAVAARLRHGLLRAAVLRQRQRARARRLRRRPRQGRRRASAARRCGCSSRTRSRPRSRRPRS